MQKRKNPMALKGFLEASQGLHKSLPPGLSPKPTSPVQAESVIQPKAGFSGAVAAASSRDGAPLS